MRGVAPEEPAAGNLHAGSVRGADWNKVDLHAHEAGDGGQGQGRPTVQAVLFYSESEYQLKPTGPTIGKGM